MGEQNQPNALETQYLAGRELNKQYMAGVGMGGIHYVPVSTPQWIHHQQAPQNYVEFLAENVATEVQVDTSAEASGFRLVNGYADMIAQEIEIPCITVVNCLNLPLLRVLEAYSCFQQIRYPRPYYEGVPINCLIGSEGQVGVSTWEPRGEVRHASGPSSEASAAGSLYPSKISRKSKAALSDKRRRMRIAERIEALGGLFPCSKQGGKADQMDEIIDHIRYLQFQLKDLSRSRLGGEPTSIPFAFLEGCGHCILDEQLMEPLEETMGRLLEVNPSMATQLLENKGLFVKPMALAEGLQHHE